jgi:hypothetical protein
MHITRRTALLAGYTGAAATALVALGACSTTTAPTPAQTAAAIAALQGVITATQNLIAAGGLTAANLAAAEQQVTALTAQIAALTAGSPVSTVFDSVTAILTQIAQYLPIIMTVIGMLAVPRESKADTPDQAHLRTGYAVLKALAGK